MPRLHDDYVIYTTSELEGMLTPCALEWFGPGVDTLVHEERGKTLIFSLHLYVPSAEAVAEAAKRLRDTAFGDTPCFTLQHPCSNKRKFTPTDKQFEELIVMDYPEHAAYFRTLKG